MLFSIKLDRWIRATLLFLGIFVIYLANANFLGTSDGYPNRYLPLSIIQEGNLELDEVIILDSKGARINSLVNSEDKIVSKYPVLTSFLALPVYVVPFIFHAPITSAVVGSLTKISAALITTFSALFLLFILRRFISEKWAVVLTLAYAFGTSAWTISSQDLWQHGASQLFLTLTILVLLKAAEKQWFSCLTGLFAGLAIAARPMNAIIVAFLFLFILHYKRKVLPPAILGIIAPLSLLAFYNTYYFGAPWATGYGQEIINWSSNLLEGFFGLLISPSRGLFIFTPFLLFSLWGIIMVWRRPLVLAKEPKFLLRYLSLAVLTYLLIMAKWWAWYGGVNYGPRMLVDLTPIFILMFVPLITQKLLQKRITVLVFSVFLLYSVFIQFVGIITWDMSWEKLNDLGSSDHSWLWDWRNNQPFYYINKFLTVY
ncbi:MAG: hypothetical protein COY66_02400 [Candidatus Kerfeldbacteria bacterium CG_4_10_14_0_8_um_filter_42_10]|uniref:Glycosyltransferase RgtA/B/C/D-like domain-containing protein n=1 Tax=Candidatus Kerfeldbacteria bacterium CG_4_10_14_0_8_um_filter_42_10 TaxID=2014248 RepID=A0A2M7RK14_9BACT|nr:MAG: hypothetical protein COY66_02400 [Candidatus Kerfeldbacteria bacterium CG_4_10_14_0_8_um_filter_42_10]